MQPMTQATLDLLKSRSMIGADKPAHRVTIGGGAGLYNWDNITDTYMPNTSESSDCPSFVVLPSGQVLYMYIVGNNLYQTTIDNLQTFVTQDNSYSTSTLVLQDKIALCANVFMSPTGGLYFNCCYHQTGTDRLAKIEIYKSALGDGSDWALYSTIQSYDWSALGSSTGFAGSPITTAPHFTSAGDWVMCYEPFRNESGYICKSVAIAKSTNGLAWSDKYTYVPTSYTAILRIPDFSRGIALFKGRLYIQGISTIELGEFLVIESSDEGETWENVVHDNYYNFHGHTGEGITHTDITADGKYLYLIGSEGQVYASEDYPRDITDFATTQYSFNLDTNSYRGQFTYPHENTVYLMSSGFSWFTNWVEGNHILGIEVKNNILPCKSIAINRTKGAASGLTITADNKGGQYSPDGATEWNQILWPNAEIIVEQGYGADLIQTYKGTLDSVEMTTFPQEIRLSARDAMKKALDQTVTGSTGNHVLIYTNSTVESIFISLCNFAGISYGTVEATGLTIARKEFAWESFADAMQWLAELVGFEIVADEQGLLHFRRDWYPTGGASVYTFTEGVDIISLGYTIDDRDLYNQVVCHGRDADGEVIELVTNVPGADYWRLPANKIMKIDASDANTIDKLNVIAARAIYLMMSRFRVCSFKAVGVPHLQVGDLITVIESSSTISEVYRVTDLSTNMDNNGYTMDITCHWYSHG